MYKSLLVISLFVCASIGLAVPKVNVVKSTISSPTPSPTPDSFETIKEFLITSAINDFVENQPPLPAKFRKVKIGHIGDTNASGSYRLCGEFLPTDTGEKPKWMGFATIKTSGYEQYIGSGTTYCTEKKLIWDTKDDLSSTLQSRLDFILKEK